VHVYVLRYNNMHIRTKVNMNNMWEICLQLFAFIEVGAISVFF
jgi:hypothetical protein